MPIAIQSIVPTLATLKRDGGIRVNVLNVENQMKHGSVQKNASTDFTDGAWSYVLGKIVWKLSPSSVVNVRCADSRIHGL